jgi:hypothetical protein
LPIKKTIASILEFISIYGSIEQLDIDITNEPDFTLINMHYFNDEILALEKFLGRPLKSWANE